MSRICTYEVDHEAAVGVPPGRAAEVSLPVRRRRLAEHRREAAGVRVRVSKVEYRREVARGSSQRSAPDQTRQHQQGVEADQTFGLHG